MFPVASCSGQEAFMVLWKNGSISAECPHLDTFRDKTPRAAVNVGYLSKGHVLFSGLTKLSQLQSGHTHCVQLPSCHYSLKSFVDTHTKRLHSASLCRHKEHSLLNIWNLNTSTALNLKPFSPNGTIGIATQWSSSSNFVLESLIHCGGWTEKKEAMRASCLDCEFDKPFKFSHHLP